MTAATEAPLSYLHGGSKKAETWNYYCGKPGAADIIAVQTRAYIPNIKL
jgi:hypothetical protein